VRRRTQDLDAAIVNRAADRWWRRRAFRVLRMFTFCLEREPRGN
jgi:hypothetical protein